MNTPTGPDGPDTELAAAEAWFRENPKAVDALALVDNAALYQRHAATIVRAALARPDAADGRTFRIGDVVRIVRVARSGNVTPPNLVGRTGTVIHVGVATANVTLPGPDGGVHVLAQDELRLDRPAAGRDLTAQDVYDALGESDVFREGYTPVVDRLNGIARPAVARTDGQPSADEPRVAGRCPSCGRGSLRATAGGHVVCTRLECPSPTAADDLLHGGPPPGLVPADDTAVQGWGDVESADFIERARAATAVGSFTAQFDHVYDPSGNLVCESVDHSTAVRIAAALSGAPADDTAAATAPWMVESRDERVDRLTRHVENVADCAGIEIEVREAGPLTGPAPLRRLVRALEGAGMLHDDPADDTAAPHGPTADEAVASAAQIVEAWAHLRMDTPEDQATHDELVRVSRATIAAYVRTRPWSSAGQPVRDSQPEAES